MYQYKLQATHKTNADKKHQTEEKIAHRRAKRERRKRGGRRTLISAALSVVRRGANPFHAFQWLESRTPFIGAETERNRHRNAFLCRDGNAFGNPIVPTRMRPPTAPTVLVGARVTGCNRRFHSPTLPSLGSLPTRLDRLAYQPDSVASAVIVVRIRCRLVSRGWLAISSSCTDVDGCQDNVFFSLTWMEIREGADHPRPASCPHPSRYLFALQN